MKEIFARLFASPAIALELIVATIFANVLMLAAPIFVMQVLNRYVAFGVDTTLATLAAGAVLAVVFEFAFRRVRLHLAERAVRPFDARMAEGGLMVLTRTPLATFELLTPSAQQHAVAGTDAIRTAYGPVNLLTILDIPFATLFIGVLWILSPPLALVATAFTVVVLLGSLATISSMKAPSQISQSAGAERSQLVVSALKSAETVRMFDAAGWFRGGWTRTQSALADAQAALVARQDLLQNASLSATALLTVAIVGTGAVLVVKGQLDVGVLIGTNLLAARILQPFTRLGNAARAFAAAAEAKAALTELAGVRVERAEGAALSEFKGGIAFEDVSFAHAGARNLLIEGLILKLEPGQTLAITGPNGSGKSTMAQLAMGLRQPTRGKVLADGVDLQQFAPAWWRRQVRYLPQEPRFLPGTIRDNLLAANPELDDAAVSRLLRAAGLGSFIDESAEGADMKITGGGDNLAVGIRRRLALARALAVEGKLLIVDEPTEGLDDEGRALVYMIMNRHAQAGGTIIACAHDPQILKGADWVVDLGRKPQPRVSRLPRSADGRPVAATPVESAS